MAHILKRTMSQSTLIKTRDVADPGRSSSPATSAHAKLRERLDKGEPLPDYFKNHPVYYAGPAKTPAGYASGCVRADHGRPHGFSYVDQFQAAGGSMVMLAKGNRSRPAVREACKPPWRLLSRLDRRTGGQIWLQHCIKKVEVLEYPELGMEAIWRIEVEDFPAFPRCRRQGQRLLQGTQFGLNARGYCVCRLTSGMMSGRNLRSLFHFEQKEYVGGIGRMSESIPPEALLIVVAVFLLFAVLALLFAIMAYVAARKAASRPILMRDEMIGLLRYESDLLRTAIDDSARSVRQETGTRLVEGTRGLQDVVKGLSDSLLKRTDAFGQRLDQMSSTSETQQAALRTMTETRFDQFVAAEAETGRELREELSTNLQRIKQGVNETLGQASDQQKERLDATERELKALAEVQKTTSEMLRQTVEGRLDLLRSENTAELEKMRATVDEKLQTTLEKRLGESFNSVVEQLNRAYEVFGEMKNISSSVSDLRNVLTNPKLRGTFGEVQLAMLIEDFLTPGQYIRDARVRDDSSERVEFAIRQPSADGDTVLLPVDAKFPA
jgi:tartrate dehydratase beta subunit/fumarate hydratase class I family protein